MVRFFTSFSAQPRLAVVTTTLEAAAAAHVMSSCHVMSALMPRSLQVSAFDIIHFLIVLAPTWLVSALASAGASWGGCSQTSILEMSNKFFVE